MNKGGEAITWMYTMRHFTFLIVHIPVKKASEKNEKIKHSKLTGKCIKRKDFPTWNITHSN